MALLALLVGSGCATSAVVARWRAHDVFERVHFSLSDEGADEGTGSLTLRWRAESRGLPDRRGERTVRVEHSDCERLSLRVPGGEWGEPPTSRWQVVELRGVLERQTQDDAASRIDPCTVLLRLREGFGHADPRFELDYRGRALDALEVDPARRPGWLLLTPVTFATDVVLAVPILIGAAVAIVLPGLDDFSWSPGHEPNWNRRRSDERREKEGSSS